MPRKKHYATERTLPRRTREWMEALGAEAGHHRERLDLLPDTTALLIIDMQKYFLTPNEHAFLPAGVAVIPNVAALRDAFRERGMPVVYTRHGHRRKKDHPQMGRWWADMLMASDPLAQIVPELRPRRGELVVRKQHYDAFRQTELGGHLAGLGVTHLVITGVMTHLCCETTARSAFMNDLEVIMTADGTATCDDGMHLSSLTAAAHGFAVPFTTAEVIGRLPCGPGEK
jgi:bifunctional isochorismate lyase/aryl carrier protein